MNWRTQNIAESQNVQGMGPLAMLGGAAISSAGSFFGQLAANKANKKLQQKQLNWNENMWHMQNQYNTPEAQMQRMSDAGLHPMLALEGMGGGNSGAPAQGVAPANVENTMKNVDPIGDYMNLKNQSQSLDNMRAERDLKLSQADAVGIQNDRNRFELNREKGRWGYEQEDRPEKKQQVRIETGLMTQRGLINNLDIKGIGYRNAAQIISNEYLEFEKIMGLLHGQAQIRQLDSVVNLNSQEWSHINKFGYKIPNKILPGLFGKLYSGNDYSFRNFMQDVATGKWKDRRGDKKIGKGAYKLKGGKDGNKGWGGVPKFVPEIQ